MVVFVFLSILHLFVYVCFTWNGLLCLLMKLDFQFFKISIFYVSCKLYFLACLFFFSSMCASFYLIFLYVEGLPTSLQLASKTSDILHTWWINLELVRRGAYIDIENPPALSMWAIHEEFPACKHDIGTLGLIINVSIWCWFEALRPQPWHTY